ncbi:hypothetical protein QNI16_31480 [Cytophagaceae bacterium YF14B1]|uniref:Uncharacterized protein n=1 Tax=Xanthocytophaga flava TaxID=3048013 RepID=A0AAE3QTA7_9BACT|nr:hypothetical protein [Xanthocytophaga flavus]MDJ1485062.1 hypothetical protein [Xanthocytophaga flavus]
MSIRNSKQSGDPQKLVEELVNLINMRNPPVHLILGPDSDKLIKDKKAKNMEEFEAYKKSPCLPTYKTLIY